VDRSVRQLAELLTYRTLESYDAYRRIRGLRATFVICKFVSITQCWPFSIKMHRGFAGDDDDLGVVSVAIQRRCLTISGRHVRRAIIRSRFFLQNHAAPVVALARKYLLHQGRDNASSSPRRCDQVSTASALQSFDGCFFTRSP
jgi:hypothetical protein